MKKQHVFLSFLMVTLLLSLALNSCKKDTATPLTLGTLTAGSIDLNGATSPNTVPVDATITATFATEVDPTTAIAANITLTEDYDALSIPLSISVSGKVITITFANKLANGALYKLVFGAGLKATNGLTLTTLNRSFTTIGTFVPSGQFAYWNFDGNANDQVGAFSPTASGIIAVTYAAGRNSTAGQAAVFNGTTSLIEIPNGDQLDNTHDFTLSFWVKSDSSQHDNFVMGLAGWYGFQFEIQSYGTGSCKLAAQYDYGDGTSGSEDLWLNGDATNSTKDNGGWQGWTFAKDLTGSGGVNNLLANKWAHILCVYNSATKVGTMYINNAKMKSQDFNLWPAGDKKLGVVGLKYAGNPANNNFVFGFIQDKTSPTIADGWADYTVTTNSHFKGQLDDVRIFHKVLTETEIGLMYNSEKP
jgi:hypothetical protein